MLRTARSWLLWLALAGAGCRPEIGDECTLSTDCSASGDRLCDTTQPGGYCTIFNCEPEGCPEEAHCVAFGLSTSEARGCADPQGNARLRRTFCLRSCGRNDDCRSGYVCAEVSGPDDPWGAEVVDRGGGKVCLVAASGVAPEPEAGTAVCRASDAGFDDWPAPVGVGGAAGSGGASGGGGGAGTGASAGSDGGAGTGGSAGAGGPGGSGGASGGGGGGGLDAGPDADGG